MATPTGSDPGAVIGVVVRAESQRITAVRRCEVETEKDIRCRGVPPRVMGMLRARIFILESFEKLGKSFVWGKVKPRQKRV